MKLRSLISVLAAILFCLPSLVIADKVNRPEIEVEVVSSEVRGLKVDLFTLITNPNDFDVYVGPIVIGSIATEWQITNSDGAMAVAPKDFFLVPAKSKRVQQLQLGYQLTEGLNHFKVRLIGVTAPDTDLPSNYIPFGTHAFEFTISTEGSK
jgi:hypothetical protein